MTRFVVRHTGPSESDGYSVCDTNREDERGRQIGRGLPRDSAGRLADLLNNLLTNGRFGVSFTTESANERIVGVLAACADAHDDYLSDEEKRANREASAKQTPIMSAFRGLLTVAERNGIRHGNECGRHVASVCNCGATEALAKAREALGE